MVRKLFIVFLLCIFTHFYFFHVTPGFAFSSVLGESFVFGNGQLFPNGLLKNGVFPNGLLTNGLFHNGDVFINGNHITSPNQRIEIRNHKIFLCGYAFPHVRVQLQLHSTPMTVEAVTDSNGYWSYELDKFPSGNHTLAMSVEDASGTKTKSTLAATFSVSNPNGFSFVNNFPPLNQLNFLTISISVISTMASLTLLYSLLRVRLHHD